MHDLTDTRLDGLLRRTLRDEAGRAPLVLTPEALAERAETHPARRRRRSLAILAIAAALLLPLGGLAVLGALRQAPESLDAIRPIAYTQGYDVQLIDATTGAMSTVLSGTSDEPGRLVGWSPDGSRLLVEDEEGLQQVSIDGSGVDTYPGFYLDWRSGLSPDGHLLASYTAPEGTDPECQSTLPGFWRIVDLTDRSVKVVGSEQTYPETCGLRGAALSWSQDGTRFVSDVPDGITVVHADGSGSERLTDGTRVDESPRWSPDGRWIAYTSWPDVCPDWTRPEEPPCTAEYRIIPATGGSPVVAATIPDPFWLWETLTWSPTSGYLAFADDRGRWIVEPDGSNPRLIDPVAAGEVLTWNLAWSPNGTHLAYQDRTAIWVLDVASGERGQVASVDHGWVNVTADGTEFGEAILDWSPDSRQVAFSDAAGLWVAPIDGGEPRLLVAGPIDSLDW